MLTSLQGDRPRRDGPPLTRYAAVATEELLSIVIRASQLGYSPWRVGIALRVAPTQVAWICAHLDETHAPTAQAVTTALAARAGDLPGDRASSTRAAQGIRHDRRL